MTVGEYLFQRLKAEGVDNGGYAMMRSIGGAKPYFELPAWDYVGLARALGGRAARVETRAALRAALAEAEVSRDFFLIDAVLDPNDVSPTWRRITRGIHARMRRAAGQAGGKRI